MPELGIAGVGLIGGSIGLRARARGWTVRAWDPNEAHLARAGALGVCDERASSFADLVARPGVLVLAGPVDAILAHVRELAAGPPRAHLTMDVASVKTRIAEAGRPLHAFVATHPIAGSERSGPTAARADLFEGRTWTYDARADATFAREARAFIEEMGARPLALASDEHDRIVALASHLPQLISVVLGARVATRVRDEAFARACGSGMRSMLRLAASSWPLWREILRENGPLVAQEVREFANVLNEAADDLERGTDGTLAGRFAEAAEAVAALHAEAAAIDDDAATHEER